MTDVLEFNKVHPIDAIEGLIKLPDNSIDLICTDPPYNITESEWDLFSEVDFILFTEVWMRECYRVSRGKYMLVFWSQQKIEWILKNINTGWKLKRIIVWSQPNSPLHCQDGLIFTWQPCFLFEKESKHAKSEGFNQGGNYISADVLTHNFKVSEREAHPTVKPLSLIMELVEKYSMQGERVLDVFMGTGTLAVACIKTKRQYLGYEREPEYLKIIEKRINNALANQDINVFFREDRVITEGDDKNDKLDRTNINSDIVGGNNLFNNDMGVIGESSKVGNVDGGTQSGESGVGTSQQGRDSAQLSNENTGLPKEQPEPHIFTPREKWDRKEAKRGLGGFI